SSRRRHTRSTRDWSSDVCSSDLEKGKDFPVFEMPEKCPVCGGDVEHSEGEVAYRCGNPACPAKTGQRIGHFVGRGGLDIEGMGRSEERRVGKEWREGRS